MTSQPLTTFPWGFLASDRIFSLPAAAPCSIPFFNPASKGIPATIPIRAIFSIIGLSASDGGLSLSSVASREKNTAPSIFATCSTGGILVLAFGSTGTAGGV